MRLDHLLSKEKRAAEPLVFENKLFGTYFETEVKFFVCCACTMNGKRNAESAVRRNSSKLPKVSRYGLSRCLICKGQIDNYQLSIEELGL